MTDRAKNYGNNPAFPTGHLKVGDYQGMTRRDLIAAMVLNGYMIGYASEIEIDFKYAARKSVMLTDYLLEELSKTDKTE